MPIPHKVLYSPVLIIDNDEFSASLIEYLLHREGFNVATAYKASHLKKIFEVMLAPELILLNARLDYADTKKFINHVRINEKWKLVPIILLGEQKDAYIDELLMAGADDFISRPYFPGEIIQFAQVYAQNNYQTQYRKNSITRIE